MKDPLAFAIKDIRQICSDSGKRTQWFRDGANGFYDSTRHFLDSSSEVAAIAVQPGHIDDLSKIMQVLAKYRVPFAIKGGGHAMNPFFSSTMGVQIYMARFDDVEYHPDTQTVDVGAGCVWDEVYGELTKRGRNVVGGASANGVGVAGYLLGGGYSLKTNQYGLGIDNIVAIQVVLPNGEVQNVHEGHYPDLFKALKGGGSNFGIVTRFTLKTHHQGKTWGAVFSFAARHEELVKAALVDFVDNEKRHEAALVAAFRHGLVNGECKFNISVMCVFDGPKPAPSDDPWQRFASISKKAGDLGDDPAGWNRGNKGTTEQVELVERDDYIEVQSMVARNHAFSPESLPLKGIVKAEEKSRWAMIGTQDARGRFGCIMVKKYTRTLIDAVAEEAKKAAEEMKEHGGKLVLMDVWPFLPSIFDNSSPSAWPHKKGDTFGPLLAYFLWESKSEDSYWLGKMTAALDHVHEVAIREGCTADYAPIYNNTSLEHTLVENIYRDELKELSALRMKYDPADVMGRTGGFKIPLPSTQEPSSPLKRLQIAGFYKYHDPTMTVRDDGFTEFALDWDTQTSTIRASGRDNAGTFDIAGIFDGHTLRFIKTYTDGELSWNWSYMATTVQNTDDIYQFSGGWGKGDTQHGTFAFKALIVPVGGNGKPSPAALMEGEWSGHYVDDDRFVATKFHLSVGSGKNLLGAGEDNSGSYTLQGSLLHSSRFILVKTYGDASHDQSWEYRGSIDASGTHLHGRLGHSSHMGGPFQFHKGRIINYAQAQAFMPNTNELVGGSSEDVRSLIEKQDAASILADGFSKLVSIKSQA